jgi:hypothetical protein
MLVEKPRNEKYNSRFNVELVQADGYGVPIHFAAPRIHLFLSGP